MGGGPGGPRSGAVGGERVAAALSAWGYETTPTPRDALADYLSRALPNATVERGGRREDADVVVDGVAVMLVDELGPRFRSAFYALADHYDGVVCYSADCHRRRPTEWRSFAYRHRSESIRFVTRPSAGGVEERPRGPGAVRMVAIPLAALGILAALAASIGLFASGESSLAGREWFFVAGAGVLALCTTLGLYGLANRREVLSILSRLAQ